MAEIEVRFPDGKRRRYPPGTPLARIAAAADRADALVARVDGRLVDLAAPLDADAAVEFLTFEDPDGRMVYWHSSAHLMAQAVKQLFPQAKLAIGPPVDDGFYYDIALGRPFWAEGLGPEGPDHRARGNPAGRGDPPLSRDGGALQAGTPGGYPRRPRLLLPAGRLPGHVPRAAPAEHGADQSDQTAIHLRGLLAGGGDPSR